jgi:hypothetical protein
VISWAPSDEAVEYTKIENRTIPLYYYKLVFSQNLSADVQAYYIASIPAQKTIRNYSYSFTMADRLMLLDNQDQARNALIHSAAETPTVFNGDDTMELKFGGEEKLTCGCQLLALYGSNLYNIGMVFKESESWLLTGSAPGGDQRWQKFRVSTTIGCVAPGTLKVVTLPIETKASLNRNVAIWQGSDGMYISDGRGPIPISDDISNFFDKTKAECIPAAYLALSSAFVDTNAMEYHWIFRSTSSNTRKEYVFDLKRWKWFEVQRGDLALDCGCEVKDTNGRTYIYGMEATGQMYRLETGAVMGGTTAITCTLETGDMLMGPDILTETRIRAINVPCKALTETDTVTISHYLDGSSTASTGTFSQVSSGKTIANVVKNFNTDKGIFHSVKLVSANNADTGGFEPYVIGAFYHIEQDHLQP